MTTAVTRAPSFWSAPLRCLLLGLGGSRGDGLWRSLLEGLHDTTATVLAGLEIGRREQRRRAPVSDHPRARLVAAESTSLP